jgi:hypothetical protein
MLFGTTASLIATRWYVRMHDGLHKSLYRLAARTRNTLLPVEAEYLSITSVHGLHIYELWVVESGFSCRSSGGVVVVRGLMSHEVVTS